MQKHHLEKCGGGKEKVPLFRAFAKPDESEGTPSIFSAL